MIIPVGHKRIEVKKWGGKKNTQSLGKMQNNFPLMKIAILCDRAIFMVLEKAIKLNVNSPMKIVGSKKLLSSGGT